MNRILLNDIKVDFTKDEFAEYCQVKNKNSPFYDSLDKYIDIVKEVAKPKAIIRWCKVDGVDGYDTTIEGITFNSKLLAEKLKEIEKVFLVVATAGDEIKKTDKIADETVKDIFSGAMLMYGMSYVRDYLDNKFGLKEIAALQPGSLPDWPIANNRTLCEMVGNVDDIGIRLNDAGYMMPWNSFSGIIFTDDTGYMNCMLCKNYDCIGRHAPFDQKEYDRIFS